MVKPSVDRGIIIPVLFGVFSVAGLCVVLLFGRLNNSRVAVQSNDTETPFDYVYLGTEPGIFELTLEETVPPADTEAPFASDTPLSPQFTPISPIAPTRITRTPVTITSLTNTPSRTPLNIPTSTPGTSIYDDTDFRLVFNGSWISQDNVVGVYQKTLHVSSTIGDSVVFSFLGQQIQFAYQAGPSLGTVTITLDSLGFSLDQSDSVTNTKTWASGVLIQGTHTVVITHTGGGSVNIDSITIPEAQTATPTATITPTP